MNERPDQNRRGPDDLRQESPRTTGNFKLNIDEKNLATGTVDLPERRRGNPAGAYPTPPPPRKAYYTEEERKAEKKAHKKRDKLKARKNRRVFSLVWLCMVLLVSFTLASYLIGGSNDFFAVGRTEGTTEVTIPENVTPEQLAKILYEKGAINKPDFFGIYCKVRGSMDEFVPATYKIATNLDYEDLINTLRGGNETKEEVTVTFPEGMTALEMALLLEQNDVCSQEEFLTALNSDDFNDYDIVSEIGAVTGRYYKLEGYLFPDTYTFYKESEAGTVIGKMLDNFDAKVSDELRSLAQTNGMTLDQAVTMASIIQGEAANASDMYNVSAVLHNRLSFGAEYGVFYLECDSTMFYPYKNSGEVPETDALAYGNYNTYKIEGLPAGAICNPGLDAITAAVKPATDGDAPSYLYFCHSADGTAYYATNLDEHEYNKELAGLN